MVRVGVLGVGSMGQNHARIYGRLRTQCDFIGLYDPDFERASSLASMYNTKAYSNMDELIDQVDAVSIAVPTKLHYEIAKKVLNYKKHTLIEKPITTEIDDAVSINNLAKENNLVLQVGHIERFNPAVQELKKIIDSEDVLAIDFKRLSPYDPRTKDTDVVQDLMIHDLDIVKFLFPNLVFHQIQAVGQSPITKNTADYAQVLMHEPNLMISLTASRITEEKIRTISVHTRHAFISADLIERKIIVSRRTSVSFENERNSSYRQESIIERVYVPNYEPLQVQLESFLDCVSKGGKPLVTGEDGLYALSMVENIRQKIYL
ncbi:Gfo/Idh/MocA family oxidoreductase [Paenibacillus naphthalenovorans]|uniref:Gfo/Idh/MocA family oxidoreductase n=1 Tax=Paenibacillus naphthalenovorans TaxID=162209 RepID=UPI003D285F27